MENKILVKSVKSWNGLWTLEYKNGALDCQGAWTDHVEGEQLGGHKYTNMFGMI